jgi:hypothetical protein
VVVDDEDASPAVVPEPSVIVSAESMREFVDETDLSDDTFGDEGGEVGIVTIWASGGYKEMSSSTSSGVK